MLEKKRTEILQKKKSETLIIVSKYTKKKNKMWNVDNCMISMNFYAQKDGKSIYNSDRGRRLLRPWVSLAFDPSDGDAR